MSSNFTIRGAAVTEGISQLKKVITNTEFVNVTYKSGTLTIAGVNKDMRAKVTLSCEGEGTKTIKFGVNFKLLSDICGKRPEIKFTRKNESSFEFKALKGTYAGDFVCTPFSDIDIVTDEIKGKTLKTGMQETLIKWLPKVIVDAPYTEEVMVAIVKSTKDALYMSCSDSYHGAAFVGKTGYGDIEINIPTQYAQLLVGLMDPKEKSYLATNENNLIFWNSRLQVSVPMVASTKNIEAVLGNTTFTGESGKLDAAKVPELLENIAAVYEEHSTILVDSDGKTLGFELKTNFGSGRDRISLSEPLPKTKFRLEPFLFKEIVEKMDGDTKIKLQQELNKDKKKVVVLVLMTNTFKGGKFHTFMITVAN